MRDHRLRARRLKLGLTQYELGAIAGFRGGCCQTYVSKAERHPERMGAYLLRQIRSALVYMEAAPLRQRQWDRLEEREVACTEALIAAGPETPGYAEGITSRLVDLLWNGRGEDFDLLAARVTQDLSDRAGHEYLDASTPVLPAPIPDLPPRRDP